MSRLLQKLAKAGVPEDRVEALRGAGVTTLDGLRALDDGRLRELAGPSADAVRTLRDRWALQRALRPKPRRRFVRYPAYKRAKLDPAWRRPRGMHNKVRQSRKGKPPKVRSGFGWTDALRHIHPSGYREVRVERPDDLKDLGPSVAVRIGGRVGRKKRLEIQGRAQEMGLRVLNPMREG